MSEFVASIVPCFLQAAERLLTAGKLEQAQYCYTQALQLAPDSLELNLKLGNVLQKLARQSAAIDCYQKVIAIKPDFWEGYHCLGDVLRQQQQWSTAVDAYRQALKLNPQFYWSYYHLGTSLSQLRLWSEAIDCYKAAIKLQPDFWEAYHALGDNRKRLKQYAAAIQAYQSAINLNPDFFWSHYNLGIIFLEQELWSEAIATFNRAKELNSNYPPLYGKLAAALQKQGNYYLKTALNYYQQGISHQPDRPDLLQQALQIEPDNFQLCWQLGQLLIQQERFQPLIKQYQTTLQYRPDNSQLNLYGDLHYDLGLAWLCQGKSDLAISSWQKTLEYNPQHQAANLKLASVMLRQGELPTAIERYRYILDLALDPETSNCCQYIIDKLSTKLETAKKTSQHKQSQHTSSATLDRSQFHIVLYTDCPQIYGAEQSSHVLMKGLVNAGYQLTCMQSKVENYLITARNQLGIKHFWVEAENVDCIANYKNYSRPRLPSTLYESSEPTRGFAITQPDLIIFADACIMSSLVPKQVAMQLNIPYIIVTHRVHPDALEQFEPYIHYLPEIYQQAQEVIVVSQNNLNLLHEQFGLDDSKGQVAYNGIPDKFFMPQNIATRQRIRRELGIPLDAIVISTNARLDVEKGYQFQFKAIEQLQQTEIWSKLYFIWSGLGGYSANLQADALKLNVGEQVKFLGNREDVADLLDAADIFLMPSLYEGMPIAIMEAMAKGLPVIATSVSGIPEELGLTGKLLPDPTVDSQTTVSALVTTILDWTQDKALRIAKGKACQQRADAMFREQIMIEQYLSIVDFYLTRNYLGSYK